MLELLASTLLVTIRNCFVIDLYDVRESVDNESSEKHSVRHFVLLNRQTHQIGKCLKFRNLDETVDVVVLEEQALQLEELLQL